MNSPIERRYTTIATLYWFDLDRSEPLETATDETLRDAVYVPALDLAAALARATAAERERDEARAECKRLRLREPTREEMDAVLGDDTEAFLGGTVRRCLDCRTPVFGGPTRCVRCAEMADVAALRAKLTRYAALERAAMQLCKSSTDAQWQALSAALDALTPAAGCRSGMSEAGSIGDLSALTTAAGEVGNG